MAFEFLNTRDARQTRPVRWTGTKADMARPHLIAAIGGYQPHRLVIKPAHLRDPGMEHRIFIEIEMPADSLGVLVNL